MRIVARFGVSAGLMVSASVFAQAIQPGDVITGSRLHGAVWGPVRGAPAASALITGPDLSLADRPVRGTGPGFAGPSFSLLIMPGARIIANPGLDTALGRFTVDPLTGDRAVLPGTNVSAMRSGGEMVGLDADTYLAIADDFTTLPAFADGRVFSYRISSGVLTLVSGLERGNGPIMYRPRAIARLDASSVLVLESEIVPAAGFEGSLLYGVDLATGNRTVLSTIGTAATFRYTAIDGGRSASPVEIPVRGIGPTLSESCRGVAVVNGRIFVGGTATRPFAGGFLEVNVLTGDRTLAAGTAVQDTLPVFAAFGTGSDAYVADAPTALQRYTAHSFVFTDTFGANRVWEYDIVTRRVKVLADLDSVILAQFRSNSAFSGLAVAPLVEGAPDFSMTVMPAEVTVCPTREVEFAAAAVGGVGVSYRWQWRAPALTPAWLDLTNGVNNDASGQPVLTATAAGTANVRVQRLATTTRPVGSFTGLEIRVVGTNATGAVYSDFAPLRLCVADFNCVGGVSLQDLFDFLGAYFAGAPGADVNGDGAVTVQDIFDFLFAYFTGCAA